MPPRASRASSPSASAPASEWLSAAQGERQTYKRFRMRTQSKGPLLNTEPSSGS